MIEAHPGFRKYRWAEDCGGGGEPTDVPCPKCGRPLDVEYECRMKRPPSVMTALCYKCQIWFDLGESPLTNIVDIFQEAVRRCREKIRPSYVQSTLDAFAEEKN